VSEHPLVSVIVPAFDAERLVSALLDSLLAQTYPRDRVQIIIADNGSRDATVERARTRPATVVIENRRRSSYAARNLGLREARGEIMAFTDVDCIADPCWIERGVAAMAATGADLVAGRIRFVLSDPPTGAEAYDALVHMDNESLVRRQGTAVTANLFVRRAVFGALGEFPVVESGGDALFTRRAVAEGFRLEYCEGAIVDHPARRLGEMLRKSWRVGTAYRLKRQGSASSPAVLALARALIPPTPGYLRRLILRRGNERMNSVVIRLGAVAWLYGLTWALSACVSMFRRAGDTAPGDSPPAEGHRGH